MRIVLRHLPDYNEAAAVTKNDLDRRVEQRLVDGSVRYTEGRRAVVAALAQSMGPRSAWELHEILDRSVPLSSLYRSLAVLEDVGVVVPHFGQKGVTRYELAEWLKGHHHHLVCLGCGAVDDVELPVGYETRVVDLVERIGSITDFTPMSHALEIEGRCARCA
jgi:Fur family transcriptional regulator, ferric uptake regulator